MIIRGSGEAFSQDMICLNPIMRSSGPLRRPMAGGQGVVNNWFEIWDNQLRSSHRFMAGVLQAEPNWLTPVISST